MIFMNLNLNSHDEYRIELGYLHISLFIISFFFFPTVDKISFTMLKRENRANKFKRDTFILCLTLIIYVM